MESEFRVDKTKASTRRQFLAAGSLAAGAAAAMLAAGEVRAAAPSPGKANLPPDVPEWMKEPGADTGSEPYRQPSKFEKGIARVLKTDTQQQTSSQSQTSEPIYSREETSRYTDLMP